MSVFLVTNMRRHQNNTVLLLLSLCMTLSRMQSILGSPVVSIGHPEAIVINNDAEPIDEAGTTALPSSLSLSTTEPPTLAPATVTNQGNPKLTSPKLYMKADPRKRKTDRRPAALGVDVPPSNGGDGGDDGRPQAPTWQCPNITSSRNLECGCDMPHTLRCSGDIHSLGKIADALRHSLYDVSLLDCTLKNVTFLSDERIFENISLHGLVISSGEIKRVHRVAFHGLRTPLQALGLPNNALMSVPWNALTPFGLLERLDLSNNRIKALGATDFVSLPNLTFLELSDNLVSSVSQRAFAPLKRLAVLKLNGNRMSDFSSSLRALGQAVNLRELNLKSNSIAGPLSRHTLPTLPVLESLDLDRNSITSIQNGALQNYPHLVTLSLRHNQIDVLQDHAFAGLGTLQSLDLGYNGIVAVSGASLQHLGRLLVLDLTHNFLRALTADLTAPLPALRELRLAGNDISMVAPNALDAAAGELRSLSLPDNPLSCDCTLRPFAEWLSVSRIPSQDLLGAICATPPRLEGAPLLQVPLESLSCDGGGGGGGGGGSGLSADGDGSSRAGTSADENANVLLQLDAMSQRESNASNGAGVVRDSGDVITLKRLHLSADYGMILTWSVRLRSDEFTCDAVFVYKELKANEILLDNSPVHCESYMMDDENIVSVILRDTSGLQLGESYRFCLVLLHERHYQRDLVVGCSNQTQLRAIETAATGGIVSPMDAAAHRLQLQKLYGTAEPEIATDYGHNATSSSSVNTQRLRPIVAHPVATAAGGQTIMVNNHIGGGDGAVDMNQQQQQQLFGSLNRSFLPGLALGILITGLFALVWGILRLKAQPLSCGNAAATAAASATTNASTMCYAAASSLHIPGATDGQTGDGAENHNHNRYLKLQATTSL